MKLKRYLNGDVAMEAIWADALDRITDKVPLSDVQKIVVNEWLTRATARMQQLELERSLTDEEFVEFNTLKQTIKEMKEAL